MKSWGNYIVGKYDGSRVRKTEKAGGSRIQEGVQLQTHIAGIYTPLSSGPFILRKVYVREVNAKPDLRFSSRQILMLFLVTNCLNSAMTQGVDVN